MLSVYNSCEEGIYHIYVSIPALSKITKGDVTHGILTE